MAVALSQLRKNPLAVMKTLNEKGCWRIVELLDSSYYGESKSLVSDSVYDSIRSYVMDKYPREVIGHKTNDDDIELPSPMASLNQYKLGSSKLAKALALDTSWCITDKLDGLSIEVVYRDGKPVEAYSRGNATHGKSLSHHIPNMSIPKSIPEKGLFIVRCEGLIPESVFRSKLHVSSGGKYKAARNAASGLMRGFKPNSKVRYIDFVAFGIIGGKSSRKVKSKQLALLKQYKFHVVHSEAFDSDDDLEEDDLVDLLEVRINRSKYELDGIVVENDTVVPKVSSSNPKHAFKFKLNSDEDSVLATVQSIVYNETKHGDLYPVAHFDPVMMSDGVTVSKAAAHNGFYVMNGYLKDEKDKSKRKKNPLGPGAVVKLVRSGKVIPYILEVIKPAAKPQLPDVEYVYDSPVFRAKERSSKQDIRMLSGVLKGLEIADMGPSSSKLLVEAGATDLADVMELSRNSLKNILGNARGTKAYQQLSDRKKSCFFGVWIRAVSTYFLKGADTTYDRILDELPEAAKWAMAGQTNKLAQAISGLDRLKNKADDLAEAMVKSCEYAKACDVKLVAREVTAPTSDKLNGVNIAFSGVRDADLKAAVKAAGGIADDGIKAHTNVLIVKDPNADTSKIQKAREKGLLITTIENFKRKYKL